MTYQEAHNYIEDLLREMTKDRPLYDKNLIEAIGVAILTIEKQIPKKPICMIVFDDDFCSYAKRKGGDE